MNGLQEASYEDSKLKEVMRMEQAILHKKRGTAETVFIIDAQSYTREQTLYEGKITSYEVTDST